MMTTHPLRDWRRRQGISLQKLAIQLETTKQTVSRIERGDREARADMLRRIAQVTQGEVTPNDMLLAASSEAV